MKTRWPIFPNDMYVLVADFWKLDIEAHDCQQILGGASVGTRLMCQLPFGEAL
jgi:hypothetical protein